MMYSRNDQKGFISLISVVIVSFVLLVAVISLGQKGIAGRFLLLDFENKEKSEALAEACVNVAKIAIANDDLYETTSTTVPVGSRECTLVSVDAYPASGKSEVKSTAQVKDATSNLLVEIDTASSDVLSWREVATF